MDAYLPLPTAARRLLLSEKDLLRLIRSGKINSATLSTGGFLVSEEEALAMLLALPKEEWPQYDPSIKGKGIGIAEAGRKYEIPNPTISRWLSKGYINQIGREGLQKILIDEADVAFCARLYRESPGQGQRRFAMIMDQLTKR